MSRITTGLLADDKESKMAKKMPMDKWEASKEDLSQDKKLAKKRGMSLSEWETSAADVKHDKQQSMEGLRGGGIAERGKGIALKKGGKVMKKADGGMIPQAAMGLRSAPGVAMPMRGGPNRPPMAGGMARPAPGMPMRPPMASGATSPSQMAAGYK